MPKRHIDIQIKEAALRFRLQDWEDIDKIYKVIIVEFDVGAG